MLSEIRFGANESTSPSASACGCEFASDTDTHLDLDNYMDTQGDASLLAKLKGARRDYVVGIGLLLVVVFLWTSSNFITQVRVAALSAKSRRV